MTLQVKNLHIEYPDKLLFTNVNFELGINEIVSVETQVLDGGTSLLRGVGGFLSGVGGQSMLDGMNLLECSAADRAMRVGYVYEDQGLVSLYSVYRNIVLPLQFHTELDQQEIHQRLLTICHDLNLDESVFGLHPHDINDVQTRLVNIARALIIEPKLLLIDELEGGMSEEYLHATITTLRERQKATPMVILITTASEFVMESSDRVYKIENNDLTIRKQGKQDR
ncbi:MAG: ATP-binding cassette domain-containing protein [Pseudomonadales bacterium]|jgi:ABC-type transporter Mla maintaining outer membrane lipid asymmetry ATPase subunit MlaF